MDNENKEIIIDSEENNEEIEIDLDKEVEKPIEKPTETLEARKARLERQLEQTNKKLGLSVEKKEVINSINVDLGESAFLIANGIKDTEEKALAKKLAKETGKDLETLLETTYFQTELKALREAKASANAVPTGNKRASNSSVDTVEYWVAKGELPPVSEVELRRKVVNARMKKEETSNQFYNS